MDNGYKFKEEYTQVKTLQSTDELLCANSNIYLYKQKNSDKHVVVKHFSSKEKHKSEVKFYEECQRKYRSWPSCLPVYLGVIKSFKPYGWGRYVLSWFYTDKTPEDAIVLESIDESYEPFVPTKENFTKLTTIDTNKDLCYRVLKKVGWLNNTLGVKLDDRAEGKHLLVNFDTGRFKLLSFHRHQKQKNILVISKSDQLHSLASNALTKLLPWQSPHPEGIYQYEFENTDYQGVFNLFNKFTEYQPLSWRNFFIRWIDSI
jgi:hypothetical protein